MLCVIATSAYAVPVDVATRTALRIEAMALGQELHFEVHLTDDVAQGLAYRPIALTLTPAEGSAIELVAETERLGDVTWSGALDEGTWTIVARYAGDPWHEPSFANAAVELVRRRVVLDVELAQTAMVGRASAPMIVRARTAGQPLEDEDTVNVTGCGQPLEPVVFVRGRALVDVPLPDDSTSCLVAIEVGPTDRHHGGASSVGIRIVRSPRLTMQAAELQRGAFDAPRFQVAGTLTDAAGPVAGGLIDVTLANRTAGEVRTSDDGSWSVDVEAPGLGAGEWPVEARFVVDVADVDPVAATAAGSVSRTPSVVDQAPRVAAVALAILLAIGLIGVLIDRWREPREARGGSAIGVPGQPGVAVEPTARLSRDPRQVVVRVIDAHHGRPVSAALLLQDVSGAVPPHEVTGRDPQVDPLGATRWRVTARAPGYLDLDVFADVPAPGHRLAVRMVSVRSRVRDVMREVAETVDVGPSHGPWWGRASTSEIAVAVRRALRTLRRDSGDDHIAHRKLSALLRRFETGDVDVVEAWDALALLVDDVYFSGRVYGPSVIEVAERLASFVRDRESPGTQSPS